MNVSATHNTITTYPFASALRFLSVLVFAFLASTLGMSAFAQTKPAELNQSLVLNLPPGTRPLKVQAAFHILTLNNIDDETETFDFSGVLVLVWKDERQAFDPVEDGVDEKFYQGAYQFNELSPAWYPQVILANASEVDEAQGVILRIKPDGTSTLTQTVNASVRSSLNLRRYPFDSQQLEAVFQVLGSDRLEVEFEIHADAITANHAGFRVPQWDITGMSASIREMDVPYQGTTGRSSALVLSLGMKRRSFFMVRSVILPLFFIVMLSWTVFWMDQSSLGDRMSVSFVGILTAVAYQIMVSDIMPQISYVTLMNAFLSFSFLITCATVLANLIVGNLDRLGNQARGQRLDRRFRWLFPLAYLCLLAIATATTFFWFGPPDR